MRKLNFNELEQDLEVIEIDQLYCIKAGDGGYGSQGTDWTNWNNAAYGGYGYGGDPNGMGGQYTGGYGGGSTGYGSPGYGSSGSSGSAGPNGYIPGLTYSASNNGYGYWTQEGSVINGEVTINSTWHPVYVSSQDPTGNGGGNYGGYGGSGSVNYGSTTDQSGGYGGYDGSGYGAAWVGTDMFAGSSFATYTGLLISKNAALLHYTADEANALQDIANALRATKVMVIAGKSIGVVGALLTLYEGATDRNGLTWGDGVKAGIGIVATFTPFGWAYGVVDIATGIITGTTLTDSIGNAIDN